MIAQLFYVICLAFLVAGQTCVTAPFGAASGFNLFVLSASAPLNRCDSVVEGAVAGAGPVQLANYIIGNKIGTDYPYEYSLVSGNKITFQNGDINGGISGTDVLEVEGVDIQIDGVVYDSDECCTNVACSACVGQTSFINFNEARGQLDGLSAKFSSWETSPNAQIIDRDGKIDLYCGPELFTVFSDVKVDSTHTQLQIHCQQTQTVLINYTPDTAGFPPAFTVNLLEGIRSFTIIHHFTNLLIQISSDVEGTIFNPRGRLAFPSGTITGSVIVDIFSNTDGCNGGKIANSPFVGCVPVTDGNFQCCSYRNSASGTRTLCSTLGCRFTGYPGWRLTGDYEVDCCSECCFTGKN